MNYKKMWLGLGFLGLATEAMAQNTLTYASTESIYHNGVELFENKSFTAARKEFENYLSVSARSLSPNHFNQANAAYFAAVAALKSNAKDSDVLVQRFVHTYPDHPKAALIFTDLADDYFLAGNFKEAIPLYEKSLKNRAPSLDTYELHYRLGISYYQQKELTKALTEFNYVKATVAESAIHAAYYAAVIAFGNENYEAALIDLRRVENVNPYKIEVPNWIAEILFRQKKYDDLVAYTEPIIANPTGRKIDEICLVTAEVFFFKDDFSKSAMYYDKFKSLRRGTVSPQVTFRHAYSLYQMGNYTGAAALFKTLASGDDILAQQSAYYLGISTLQNKQLLDAKVAFRVAQKMDFDAQIKEEATYNLIKILLDGKENAEAISQLQAYLAQYPTGKYVDESNELLSEVFFSTNNYQSAIDYIEKLAKRTPKINEAYQKITYNQGVIEFNAESYDKSIVYFDKSLSTPVDPQLRLQSTYWKAEALFLLNKPDAEEMYKTLISSSDKVIRLNSVYSLAYLYFNQKKYSNALLYFSDFVNKAKGNADFLQKYEDALLRTADCQLADKKFSVALSMYEEAYRQNRIDKDYALYYSSVTLQYMNRDQEAKQRLAQFLRQFGNSRLIDEALFRKASIAMEEDNNQEAVQLLSDLLQKKPSSSLVSDALLKRASAFSNLQNYDRSIADYTIIVKRFPKSPAASEALLGLKDVYGMSDNPEEYARILEEFEQKNPENNSVESLQFENAKTVYFNGKYLQAAQLFERYLSSYPSNSNAEEANYYLGESYNMLKNSEKALGYYSKIISRGESTYYTLAAYRAAGIYVEQKAFQRALPLYKLVLESSSDKRQIMLSQLAILVAQYELGNYAECKNTANQIISDGNEVVANASNKALLYKLKAFAKEKNRPQAEQTWEQLQAEGKDIHAAEGLYELAYMLFADKKYEQSNELIDKHRSDYYAFSDWFDMYNLLIADNYLGEGDTLNAREVLNAIIENSKNEAMRTSAREKLTTIR
ncbi:MAG: tetratricopeptide repeat protein [Spirosomataceae bacterium]